MLRRQLMKSAGMLAVLAGCGGQIPVEVKLPPEIQESVDDVLAIIKKVQPIAQQVGEVAAIVTKATEMVNSITNANAGSVLQQVADWLSPLTDLAKPLGASVTTAIATLLPLIGGRRVAARTGMSPVVARQVLRS